VSLLALSHPLLRQFSASEVSVTIQAIEVLRSSHIKRSGSPVPQYNSASYGHTRYRDQGVMYGA
jgi:hypothetical protein